MDDIKIEPIIPLRLKRRINRLIPIDDILNEEPDEPNIPLEEHVCLIFVIIL